MIWVLKFLIEAVLAYPGWVLILDVICTLIVGLIFACGVAKAIKTHKRGGLKGVKAQTKRYVS